MFLVKAGEHHLTEAVTTASHLAWRWSHLRSVSVFRFHPDGLIRPGRIPLPARPPCCIQYATCLPGSARPRWRLKRHGVLSADGQRCMRRHLNGSAQAVLGQKHVPESQQRVRSSAGLPRVRCRARVATVWEPRSSQPMKNTHDGLRSAPTRAIIFSIYGWTENSAGLAPHLAERTREHRLNLIH